MILKPGIWKPFICAALVVPGSFALTVESMTHDFPQFLPGAPLQVVGVTLNVARMDLADDVTLINLSDRPITHCTLGWVYRQQGDDAPGEIAIGRLLEVNLLPMSIATVGSQGIGFNSARAIFIARGITRGEVVVGVVYARFRDGGEWNYQLSSKRRFEQQDDEALRNRIRPFLLEDRARRTALRRPVIRSISAGSGCRVRLNEKPMPATGSVWNDFLEAFFGWFKPATVHAMQCNQCWVTVCNPSNKICTISQGPYGQQCGSNSCTDPYQHCYTASLASKLAI